MSSKQQRNIVNKHKNTHQQIYKKNNHHESSSSLIEILQSFGIRVNTKVSYHGQKKRDDFDRQFLDQFMNTKNEEPVLCGYREDNNNRIDKAINEGKVQFEGHYFINVRKSRIITKFKCAFDHMEALESNNFKNDKVRDWNYHTNTNLAGPEKFKNICDIDRKDRNVMNIEFDLKFDSFVEVVKYLNVSNFSNVKYELENEILSRLVEILDVDNEKKQVYIKLKTFEDKQDTNPNLCHYYLMGKIDGTDSCFMLDLTYRHWYERNTTTTIDKIYRHFTPNFLKDRIYGKGSPNTFHDCKDIGIYRVLIGCFFHCMTSKSAGNHVRYSKHHPSDIMNARFSPSRLTSEGESVGVIAEKYLYDYHGGMIDTGYYSFELKSICQFHMQPGLRFTREFHHFSL